MGGDKLHLEHTIADSEPDRGYLDEFNVPIHDFRLLADYGPLLAASDPNLSVASAVGFMEWSALDSNAVLLNWKLPGTWVEKLGNHPAINDVIFGLILNASLVGSGTNANLLLDASLKVTPIAAASTAALNPYKVTIDGVEEATPASGATIGGHVTAAVAPMEIGFFWDLKSYDIHSGITISLGPNEAIGANLDLRVYGVGIQIQRHASLARRADRKPIY